MEQLLEVELWSSSLGIKPLLFAVADKSKSKNLSSGNITMDADAIEPCDHHLDCLPGQSPSSLTGFQTSHREDKVFFASSQKTRFPLSRTSEVPLGDGVVLWLQVPAAT